MVGLPLAIGEISPDTIKFASFVGFKQEKGQIKLHFVRKGL